MNGDYRAGARYYAAFLDLHGRECVVVGGGEVALRKAEALLEAGARVTVVSPEALPELRALADAGRIRWQPRPFAPGDLAGCRLAIAATDDPGVQRDVFAEAEAVSCFCNVVDVPELCSFILPAILRRGEVTIAVSTAGASPTLAQRIRDRIAACIGEEYGRLAALLRDLRPEVHRRWPGADQRRAIWSRVVDAPLLGLLREGRDTEARRLASEILERPSDTSGSAGARPASGYPAPQGCGVRTSGDAGPRPRAERRNPKAEGRQS